MTGINATVRAALRGLIADPLPGDDPYHRLEAWRRMKAERGQPMPDGAEARLPLWPAPAVPLRAVRP